MSQINETELKRQIKDNKISNLYFLFGHEKYLVRNFTEKLISRVLEKGFNDFNYQEFDAQSSNIDDISDAVEALPLMSDRKCVKVKDLDVESINEAEMSKLKEMLSDVPESTVLIISLLTLNFDIKKAAKWKKFITFLNKVGVSVEFSKMDTSKLKHQLVIWAEKQGSTLNLYNAGKIVELCGTDLTLLKNEMEKFCAFAKNSEITGDVVEKLAVRNLETTVFVLSNALVSGNYQKAYELLDSLFYKREEPVAILAVLASAYIDMYRVRICIESGGGISDVSKNFDYKGKEFKLKYAQRDSRGISTESIKKSIIIMLRTDIELKSSRIDKRVLLEEMISKLFLVSNEGGHS